MPTGTDQSHLSGEIELSPSASILNLRLYDNGEGLRGAIKKEIKSGARWLFYLNGKDELFQ